MGGGDVDTDIEPSAAEKIEAQRGVDKYNERAKGGYVQLEGNAIKEASRDRTQFLANRATADIAQSTPRQAIVGNSSSLAFEADKQARMRQKVLGKVQSNAAIDARGIQDQQKLNLVRTGQDIAVSNDQLVSGAARRGAQRGIAEMENNATIQNARNSAISQVASTAIKGGIARHATEGEVAPGDDRSNMQRRIDDGFLDFFG